MHRPSAATTACPKWEPENLLEYDFLFCVRAFDSIHLHANYNHISTVARLSVDVDAVTRALAACSACHTPVVIGVVSQRDPKRAEVTFHAAHDRFSINPLKGTNIYAVNVEKHQPWPALAGAQPEPLTLLQAVHRCIIGNVITLFPIHHPGKTT